MELLSSVLRWTARSTPQLRWNPSPNAQEPCRIKFTDPWCKVTRELWKAISILFQYTKDKRVKRLCENRCTTSITTHHCIYLDSVYQIVNLFQYPLPIMTSGKRVFLAKETMSFEFSIQVPYDMVHVFIFTQSYRNTIIYEVRICLAYFCYHVYY